jgi:hypothetical protein
MNGKDLDGSIDEVCALVINQSKWATKLNDNEFINQLKCDYKHIGP